MRSTGSTRDIKILFEIPTLRVALRVRLAIKLLAQDDTQNIKSTHNVKIKIIPSLKVFESWGCGGRKAFFKKFSSPTKTFIIYYSSIFQSPPEAQKVLIQGDGAPELRGRGYGSGRDRLRP